MSDANAAVGPHHLPSRRLGGNAGHGAALTQVHGHDAAKRIVVAYGFWIFLISDIILFAAFFATYAVLTDSTAGGPAGKDIFDIPNVAIETACLLTSSLFCGVAAIGANARRKAMFQLGMAATFVLGAAFLALEVREFADLVEQGNGPQRSAFLSAFFALIGCHGLHVTAGLLWLLTMMAQVAARGFRPEIQRRILCFALFWHTLDIIWVALFSLVYLVGVAR
jgi:cytochrome o ubiquinol oxidase subunit 3